MIFNVREHLLRHDRFRNCASFEFRQTGRARPNTLRPFFFHPSASPTIFSPTSRPSARTRVRDFPSVRFSLYALQLRFPETCRRKSPIVSAEARGHFPTMFSIALVEREIRIASLPGLSNTSMHVSLADTDLVLERAKLKCIFFLTRQGIFSWAVIRGSAFVVRFCTAPPRKVNNA